MAKSIKKITQEELLAVDNIAGILANIKYYRVKITKDIISFMCADKYVSDILLAMEKYMSLEQKEHIENNINEENYNEIIRFKLVDKENRLFVMMLKFTLKDENDFWVSKWEYVGKRLTIEEAANKYLPHIEYGDISGVQPNFALSPMESKILDN